MEISWITDAHLDFLSDGEVLDFLSTVKSDALYLTGDISNGSKIVGHLHLLQRAFPGQIFFVLGNHDFYGCRVDQVREAVAACVSTAPRLVYLRDQARQIGPHTALVGVDGFSDGMVGQADGSFRVNDETKILDLKYDPNPLLLRRELGRVESEKLRESLQKAAKLSGVREVHVLTHIPPYAQSAWWKGGHSQPSALPYMVCGQAGLVLAEEAAANPSINYLVFCGHTHHSGTNKQSPNLTVYTGAATYGKLTLAGKLKV